MYKLQYQLHFGQMISLGWCGLEATLSFFNMIPFSLATTYVERLKQAAGFLDRSLLLSRSEASSCHVWCREIPAVRSVLSVGLWNTSWGLRGRAPLFSVWSIE